jgi:RNA polymerase sigma-70 factor (ECF subfamily)
MQIEDQRLVEKYLGGDESAFSELVNKYLKPVYNFIYQLTQDRSTLDDLTQITFLKAWKNLGRFDQTKSFKTWLFVIAKNNALDHLKKKKSLPFTLFENEGNDNILENISDENPLPDEILNRQDIASELEKKLDEIPGHYRIILLMHYRDDFSLQEIAEILDRPYNTIKSQHVRALAKIKELLIK